VRQAGQGRQPNRGAAALASTPFGVGLWECSPSLDGVRLKAPGVAGGGYEFADRIGSYIASLSSTALACALVDRYRMTLVEGLRCRGSAWMMAEEGARRLRLVLECFT